MKRIPLIVLFLFLSCQPKDNPVSEPIIPKAVPKFTITVTVRYLGDVRQQGYVTNASLITAYEVRLRVDRDGKDGNTLWFYPSTMKKGEIRYYDTGSGSRITKLTVGYN